MGIAEELEVFIKAEQTRRFIAHNIAWHAWRGSKLFKEHGTSATGSITKLERSRRNKLKKLAKASKKRNRVR